jgi:tRNA threonylcarbamoyladenosine biosynthesis protein TsaE
MTAANEFFYRETAGAAEMEALGFATKKLAPNGTRLFLSGQLGAGKTVFCRGYLRAAGYSGRVKSPTFTIVESYTMPNFVIHHFDLYRIDNPIELDFIGLEQYFDDQNDVLVEWPINGQGTLPLPDVTIEIVLGSGSELREVKMNAENKRGLAVISGLREVSVSELSENFCGLEND